MAIDFRVQGVDFSGVGNAIAGAIQQSAEIRRREDALAEQRVDEFQKNYNPSKLRGQDLPVFTTAFENYKQAALKYSRLNRGGAKPAEIALANEIKDRALNEMNNIYQKSASVNEKQAEYAEYIKNARLKGYSIPDNVNNTYNSLSSSDVFGLDVDKIPSAWSNPMVASEVDFDKLNKYIDGAVGKQQGKNITYEQGTYLGKTAGGQPLYGRIPLISMSRDAFKTTTALELYAKTKPEVDNAAKSAYDELATGLQAKDPLSIKQFDLIKSALGKPEATIEDIGKYGVLASSWYLPTVSRGEETFKMADFQADQENEAFDRSVKIQGLNNKSTSTFEHPSQAINDITQNWQSYEKANIPELDKNPNAVNVTSKFSSYTLPTNMGGKTNFAAVVFNPGGKKPDGGRIEPFVTYATDNDPTSKKVMSLEQFNQMLVKNSPDVTFKGSQKIRTTVTPKIVKKTSPGTKGKDPLGILGN